MKKFYIPDDLGDKECPDCHGKGYFAISECCNGEIIDGICIECAGQAKPLKCQLCNGEGRIERTEQDAWNDYENEQISISESNKDE
jgi:DnaJ-class molecular chaperone